MKLLDPCGKRIMIEHSKEYVDNAGTNTLRNSMRFARHKINQ